MPVVLNTSESAAEHWDRVADRGDLEVVPLELPQIGGFEFLVVDQKELSAGTHAAGGYDSFDTETEEVSSLIIVGDAVPRHVRGLLVAHLLLHKIEPDDGGPELCRHFDGSIQQTLADCEPDLIKPFYDEMKQMYLQGYDFDTRRPVRSDGLLLDRYGRAIKHAESKGTMVDEAADAKKRLEDNGLVLPDSSLALNAVDRRTGHRTHISLQTERSDRHKCKNCSHPILRGADRITTSTKQRVGGYDHHHYHPGCFTHVELGVFGDFHQTENSSPQFPLRSPNL